MSSTSCEVFSSCGDVVGTTLMIAVVPELLTTGGLTEATPGVVERSCCSALNVDWASDLLSFDVSMTTVSGPFAPGPNPSLIRS